MKDPWRRTAKPSVTLPASLRFAPRNGNIFRPRVKTEAKQKKKSPIIKMIYWSNWKPTPSSKVVTNIDREGGGGRGGRQEKEKEKKKKKQQHIKYGYSLKWCMFIFPSGFTQSGGIQQCCQSHDENIPIFPSLFKIPLLTLLTRDVLRKHTVLQHQATDTSISTEHKHTCEARPTRQTNEGRHQRNEHQSRAAGTPASYSEDHGFEPRRGDCIFRLKIFVVSLIPFTE